MGDWYLLRGGQTHGPYPEEQVREWVRTGQVGPEEKLNREGDPTWLSVDMIPEFAAERATRPPGGVPYVAASATVYQEKDRTISAILAILLGYFGIHHFYLGNTSIGLTYLLLSVLSCGALAPVIALLGIVDGVIYLVKPEAEFQRNCHHWFCSGT